MGVSKGTRNVIKRIRRKSELLTRLKCIVALSFGEKKAAKLVEVVVPCEKDVLEVPAIKSFKNQFKPLKPQERQSRSKTVKTILAAEEFLTKDALAKLENGNSCLISFVKEIPTRRETAPSPTRNLRDGGLEKDEELAKIIEHDKELRRAVNWTKPRSNAAADSLSFTIPAGRSNRRNTPRRQD